MSIRDQSQVCFHKKNCHLKRIKHLRLVDVFDISKILLTKRSSEEELFMLSPYLVLYCMCFYFVLSLGGNRKCQLTQLHKWRVIWKRSMSKIINLHSAWYFDIQIWRQTWSKGHCGGLINSFAEVDIDEVKPNSLVFHSDLTLLWLSYFHVFPLQNLPSCWFGSELTRSKV